MLLRKASNFKFKRCDTDSSRRVGRIRETFVDFLLCEICENEFKIHINYYVTLKTMGKKYS